MSETFAAWRDRAAIGLIVLIFTGGMSLFAWHTTQIFAVKSDVAERPTDEEVRQMILSEAPYIKDRALILAAVGESKQFSKELRTAIDNNTKAIIQLQAILERDARSRQ